MSLALALATGALYACGTYLLLQRRLTRIILGVTLLGHGSILVLLMAGGRAGDVPIVDGSGDGAVSDPLVQAMALTAIVITFGVVVFLLALANRSWELTGDDEVEDDLEDRRLARLRGDEQLAGRFEPVEDEREFEDPSSGDDTGGDRDPDDGAEDPER